MADSALSVHNMFKGKIVYINVMCNLSVDCDCCEIAKDPCMKDIGVLAKEQRRDMIKMSENLIMPLLF